MKNIFNYYENIKSTRFHIRKKMKIMPITNSELDAVQKNVDEPSIKTNFQKNILYTDFRQ